MSETDKLRKDQENEARQTEKSTQSMVDKKAKKQKGTFWLTRDMAEERGNREELLSTTFKEFIIYVVFVTLMTIYVTGIRSAKVYYLTKTLSLQFAEREFHTIGDVAINFHDIRTAGDFWAYAENHMIGSFFWESTYAPGHVDDNAMNIQHENKVLGVPRIRQVKVRNDSCIVHEYFRRLFLNCYDHYSDDAEDRQPFGPETSTAWKFSTTDDTKSLAYWGMVSQYGGGGFYEDFPKNKNETIALITGLKDNLWITRGTRAVFVDFSLYNANLNIFSICKLVFEFPATGGVMPTADIKSIKFLRFQGIFDWFVAVCEILAYLIGAFYVLEEIREMVYFKWRYLVKFWNYIDFAITVITVATAVISLVEFLSINEAIERVRDNENQYGNLEYIAFLHVLHNNIIAVDLFLIYLKIFKFMNFNKTMGQLNSTLRKCAKDILGFSIMFFIIFFAFAELGYLLFGSQVDSFSSFGVAMFTLLRTILGDFDYEEIERANRILAPIYFLSYIFLVFFVLLNMFLAIINDTYADVKTEIAIAPDELQMTEFIYGKIKNMLRKMRCGFLLPKVTDKKSELNATIRQIRETLRKCGFSDLEIEMFFARYNIDPLAEIAVSDIEKLLTELDNALKGGDVRDGSSYVKLADFVAQQERLEQIDKTIAKLVEQVKLLLLKLERMENVRKMRNA
ncbi:hypothetical protein JTB14_028723 [Gonioctena quinquepunctata]|nr:hypothetical protein JTB14_028723 [Gonioctena quinquepunctata]